ncbi:hypothetical protein DNI29_11550 [Hymenobacter sediminis]|uniref:hypothetical protein n=1 Tax=Hymenobacter sediminis TaxID=2218621 RepID=UPI000DA6C21F|nr:hypothetical protein [Hymenobacter sediminis]RPD46793.1 hypothetical protein DNI29_11550 [Hymenobacter sediminis]
MDSKPFAQLLKFLFWCIVGLALLVVVLFAAMLLSSCAGSKPPKPVDTIGLLTTRVKTENPATDSAKPVSGIKAVAQKVKNAVSSIGGSGKFKNKGTIIYQVGPGNTAASATKPGTMATGTEATATNAKKADAVVVGDGSQAAKSSKGPAVAGEGNQIPITKESWLRAALPYAAGGLGLVLLYSLLPLGLTGSGWLLAVLRRGRSREPETG